MYVIWEYIFIRTCIFFLHLIAPFSTLYSLARSLVHPLHRVPHLLEVWLAPEATFYLLVYLPRRAYLQRVAVPPTTLCCEDRRLLFRRCHDNIPDPERYLSKWFLDAPAEEIRRENVKDFFRWAFLNTRDRDPAHDEEKMEPGRGKAKCLRLTYDKVAMSHRSLAWYLCVSVVDTLTSAYLRYQGFDLHGTSLRQSLIVFPFRPLSLFTRHRSPAKTLTYWHRPHTSKTRLPVLFIHGIGIGLYPYVNFLVELNAENGDDGLDDGQRGIFAVEIMPVSFRITKAHGWDKVVLVSHSYGSVISTHLLHSPRTVPKIGPMLFVDPVTFLLHLPDVAYNFIYRKPTRANEHQLSYFASKDMGVAHTLSRRFYWADNILWKEDLQNHRVAVSLAEKDLIVDTTAIGAYLTGADGWILRTRDWKDGIWQSGGLEVL
ncbi:uncharacterized protein B0T15DRAFT_568446 [Chaetomium strumarium]|uniref:AB hydrolase-1 domain-containing protein n=1 Tax=Chaetomium strumarium TaxID=1170767 RepID=A0AAJ0GRA3_9PEZI|nr:hypothetical protein B0T15DRAFT_568446 [Chaetomium strumarium]